MAAQKACRQFIRKSSLCGIQNVSDDSDPRNSSDGSSKDLRCSPPHTDMLPIHSSDSFAKRALEQLHTKDRSTWLPRVFNRDMWMHSRPHKAACSPDQQYGDLRGGVAFHASAANHLGNPPFSDAVTANHHALPFQEWQRQNIFAPSWALQLMNTPGSVLDPFDSVLKELRADIQNGTDPETLCGSHAYVGALHDEATFRRAPKLSQVSASMTRSMKPEEPRPTVTQYAIMFAIWSLWKWVLAPSPQTYHDLPACLRPTPWQYFSPHVHLFDFVYSPALRDELCRTQNAGGPWITELCKTLHCDWSGTIFEALSRNSQSGELDLNPRCKVCAHSFNFSCNSIRLTRIGVRCKIRQLVSWAIDQTTSA